MARGLFEQVARGAADVRGYRVHPSVPRGTCAAFRELRVRWSAAWDLGCATPQPAPAELESFYGGEYRRVMGKARGVASYIESPNYRAQTRSQVDWVVGEVRGHGRWLDVGAGYGLLLREVADALPAWTRLALEPDAEAQHDLARVAEVLPFTGPTALDAGLFEVISCSHVLEHVADPLAYLGHLRESLRASGLLLLEVPNDDRVALTDPNRTSDLPHLWFFSRAGLERLARAAGFSIVRSAELGLERPGTPVGFGSRARRFLRRRFHGNLSLLDDPTWYTEGVNRTDLRILARRGGV
ncbi:MAG: class I SAM-dependent methyltransferase [bacterium]|nr:class I SAM-dependent methyltransferase [bacterium]